MQAFIRADRVHAARPLLLSCCLAGAVCPLIGGCPPQALPLGPGLESAAIPVQAPRDAAAPGTISGAILNNCVIPLQGEVVSLNASGSGTTIHHTPIPGDDPERVIPAVLTPPTVDLLVKTKGGLYWMEGQADGSFTLRPPIAVGSFEPFDGDNVVAADFNGDSTTDVAMVSSAFTPPTLTTTFRVFTNDGAGAFSVAQALQIPNTFFPGSLDPGDANGDQYPDLLIVGAGDSRVLTGRPDGTFWFLNTSTGISQPTPTPSLPGALCGLLTNAGGDGNDDIVLCESGSGLSVRAGNGAGVFPAPVFYAGINAFHAIDADFNLDGLTDIAIAGQTPGTVSIYHGQPGGALGAPLNLPGPGSARRIGVFQLPGNPRPNLFTVHKTGNLIQTYINSADGWRTARRIPFVTQTGSRLDVRDGARADLNGDGYDDIAAGDSVGYLSFTLSAGDGSDTLLPTRAEDLGATITHVLALEPLAGQGDNRQPVAVTNSTATAVIARLDTGVNPPRWEFPQAIGLPLVPSAVATGDFNHDGRPDLAFSHSAAGGSVTIVTQSAAGVFENPQPLALSGGAWGAITSVDLDGGDGDDLILADPAAGTVKTFLNIGAGAFSGADTLAVAPPLASNVAAADATGEGTPDIIVGAGPSGGDAGAIVIYLVDPDGRVDKLITQPVSVRPVHVAAGDIDGDGRADIVAPTVQTSTNGDGVLALVMNSAGGIGAIPPTYHYANGKTLWADVLSLRAPRARGAPTGPRAVAVLGATQLSPYEGLTLLDATPALVLPCPGDANGDRVVDFLDLNIVLSDFGLSGAPGALAGDLDDDGDCDFIDLNIVLSAFGVSC